ncbi:MAG: PDZ domain-containing protein, partial [Micropepsaceae bacterium]
IYFARHARSGEADRFDRSGLWINRDSVGYRIDGVVAGSPAAEAGLHVGDIVLEVDGAAAHSISLGDLRDRLRDGAPGSEVRFKVRSGVVERNTKVRLRDLF